MVIIGITGGSASGKSRLAHALADTHAHGTVIEQDAYYYRSLGPKANFDHPNAIEWPLFTEHVIRLRDGKSIDVPRYDFVRHERVVGQARRIDPHRLVIVEGLHILREPTLRSLLTLALFVDTPADVRLVRRVRRDAVERGRSLDSILDQYERQVRPMHHLYVEPTRAMADRALDGTRPPSENVGIVEALALTRGLTIW